MPGFDHEEPDRTNRSYRPPMASTSGSQMTEVYDPRSDPALQELGRRSVDISKPSSEMSTNPYAPSPPEAPTFYSVASDDDDSYGPERSPAHHTDFTQYASLPPQSSPSVGFNPAPFIMGIQSDSLVHRDFKDDLARAAGTVTPGVSDGPYIRYAIEALTRHRSDGFAGADENVSSNSDTDNGSRSQIIPQFSVRVSRVDSDQQPQDGALSELEAAPKDGPVQNHTLHTPVGRPRQPIGQWQSAREPVRGPLGEPVRKPVSQPVREPAMEQVREKAREPDQEPAKGPSVGPTREPARPPQRTRVDEIVDEFNRAKALVLQSMAGPPPNPHPPRTVSVWQTAPDSLTIQDMVTMGHRMPPPPPLTHKPWILQSWSLFLFATLCILMLTAIVFSAVYSVGRDGFTPYAGSIYGGQYFLFRVLPQLVGAALLVYAQCIIASVHRVFPFSAMASDDRRERRNAVFFPLYPLSFLWPQLFGPWNVWVPTLVVWLTNFTIPLLSCLYTVVFIDDVWTWATSQGVAWTLVAMYILLLLSIVLLFAYWRNRRTGMIESWDVRSIADVIFLVAQSNSQSQYWGLETAASRSAMKKALEGSAERLGYWTTPEYAQNAFFWSFGVPTTKEDLETERWDKKNWAAQRDETRPVAFEDVENQEEPWAVRFRYLPWCFRDVPLISFVAVGTVLFVALVVVSFLPTTDIRNGFLPGLSAGPLPGAFSPADFVYSFIPSLIGLVLFLGFQSLDLTLRILEPWGELGREEGSRAEKSLLLDYAACLPWQSTFKAIKMRHWRVACITFVSPLFIVIPVLGGGLFMALTPPTGPVRIFPNVPIFAVILAFLVVYLMAVASLIPHRKQYRLPHGVTCLAEIMSFCSNEQLRADEAWDQTKISRRNELEGALDCGKDWHRQGRWTFGAGKGGGNDERLGIKRYSKYTVHPKSLGKYDQFVRGKPISGPLLHGSGPLFGN
ncbi:hypothetical protein GGR50DRAFT_668203 [Xylaria sp. CBS 124048]|nr:hypothetical protein GGR50DRAFT_668203 [Xylaria sp. CBS 124048]